MTTAPACYGSGTIVHDRATRCLSARVSVGSSALPDGDSKVTVVADAGGVVFQSTATNLVAGDTNNASDVFCEIVAVERSRQTMGRLR